MPWFGLGGAAGGGAAGGLSAGISTGGALGAGGGLGVGGATSAGLGAGGLGIGGAAATPGLSLGAAGGAGGGLGSFLGTAGSIAGAAKGAADFVQAGAKKAMEKIPTAKSVTGNKMTDFGSLTGLGHRGAQAAEAGMKALNRGPANLAVDFSKTFPTPKVPAISATPSWADPIRAGMAQVQDWAKKNPKTAAFAQNVGQQILSPPGGQAAPATGAPNVQFNQGQQRGQSAEDQMNGFLMQLFQGRQ